MTRNTHNFEKYPRRIRCLIRMAKISSHHVAKYEQRLQSIPEKNEEVVEWMQQTKATPIRNACLPFFFNDEESKKKVVNALQELDKTDKSKSFGICRDIFLFLMKTSSESPDFGADVFESLSSNDQYIFLQVAEHYSLYSCKEQEKESVKQKVLDVLNKGIGKEPISKVKLTKAIEDRINESSLDIKKQKIKEIMENYSEESAEVTHFSTEDYKTIHNILWQTRSVKTVQEISELCMKAKECEVSIPSLDTLVNEIVAYIFKAYLENLSDRRSIIPFNKLSNFISVLISAAHHTQSPSSKIIGDRLREFFLYLGISIVRATKDYMLSVSDPITIESIFEIVDHLKCTVMESPDLQTEEESNIERVKWMNKSSLYNYKIKGNLDTKFQFKESQRILIWRVYSDLVQCTYMDDPRFVESLITIKETLEETGESKESIVMALRDHLSNARVKHNEDLKNLDLLLKQAFFEYFSPEDSISDSVFYNRISSMNHADYIIRQIDMKIAQMVSTNDIYQFWLYSNTKSFKKIKFLQKRKVKMIEELKDLVKSSSDIQEEWLSNRLKEYGYPNLLYILKSRYRFKVVNHSSHKFSVKLKNPVEFILSLLYTPSTNQLAPLIRGVELARPTPTSHLENIANLFYPRESDRLNQLEKLWVISSIFLNPYICDSAGIELTIG